MSFFKLAKCNQSCSINYMLNFSTCQSRFNSIIKFKGNNQRKCRLFVTQSTHDIVRRGVLGIYRCTFCFLQRNNQRALHILTNSPISHWVDTCSTLWCKAKQTQTDICRDSFHHNCHLPFKWLFVMWMKCGRACGDVQDFDRCSVTNTIEHR